MRNRIGLSMLNSRNRHFYSEEAQAVFDRMSTPLTTSLKNAYAAFIDSQVASLNHEKQIKFFYAANNNQDNSLKDWFGGTDASLNGNAYWTPFSDWYTQGAVGDFINTNFIPNNIAAFDLNDCAFSVFVKFNNSTGTGSKNLGGCLEPTTTRQILISQSGSSTTNIGVRMNGSTILNYTPTGAPNGVFKNHALYTVVRTSATRIALYENGVQVAESLANAVGTKSTVTVYIGGRNNNGTHEGAIDCSYKMIAFHKAVGFDHLGFYNDLVTLNAAVDAIVPNIPVFFSRGQSNAAGKAEVNRLLGLTSYVASETGSKVYYKATLDNTDNGNWRKLILGTNNGELAVEATTDHFGIEGALGKILLDAKNIPLYISKTGRGGSSLATVLGNYNDWNPLSGTTDMYDVATDGYDLPALADIVSEYPNKNIKPVLLWHQGETDKDVPASLSAYAVNFAAFVAAWRAENALFATAPLIITKVHYDLDANEDTLNAIFDAYAAGNPNVYVIDPGPAVTYPRNIDLPAEIKLAYPPTGNDDNHNSHEFQIKKSEMVYGKLVEIGYI